MTKLIIWIKTHTTKILVYIVSFAIVTYLFMIIYPIAMLAYINFVFSPPVNRNENSKLPQPLSTRGLPPPETDVPVTLPPDPGEAGKATLAGIDSNNDGVRDDLEREIVYMYPKNEEVRRVLRAMVKKGQEVITSEGDHEHFKNLQMSLLAFQTCYEYLVYESKNVSVDFTHADILFNMLRNTPERKKKDQVNENSARPYGSPLYNTIEACTQPLVQGQY